MLTPKRIIMCNAVRRQKPKRLPFAAQKTAYRNAEGG